MSTASPHLDPIKDWDAYFLAIAETVKRKSKDPRPNGKVGAVIASGERVVLATGFNGLARGVPDDEDVLGNPEEKLHWVCHAESNAILNAARVGTALQGSTIYVTKFPCLACLNSIIQAGIRAVRTDDHKFWDDDPFDQEESGYKLHDRKRLLISKASLRIVAPNHPEYRHSLRPVPREVDLGKQTG